jgi:hypothetical protein
MRRWRIWLLVGALATITYALFVWLWMLRPTDPLPLRVGMTLADLDTAMEEAGFDDGWYWDDYCHYCFNRELDYLGNRWTIVVLIDANTKRVTGWKDKWLYRTTPPWLAWPSVRGKPVREKPLDVQW